MFGLKPLALLARRWRKPFCVVCAYRLGAHTGPQPFSWGLPMPRLKTPTYEENLWTTSPLFGRYKLTRGQTLLVSGTTVTATTYPYQADLDAYDHVYLGGHEYDLTAGEVTILTNAGYGAYIT